MALQQHLPRDKDATGEQQWGYTFYEFVAGNFWYLLGILIVLAIFLYARSYFNRHR